nr:hypothetical protein [Myxococcota bacterium]
GPACADFRGAYGFPLGDPCVRDTVLELGTFCVTQTECDLTIATSLGALETTAEGETLRFELDGLSCTAGRDRGAITITCEDAAVGFTCESRAAPTRALDGACCESDDTCGASQRCAPIALGLSASVPIVSACVRIGDRARDQACVTGGSGIDDCGAGLTCSAGSLGDDMLVCRPICSASADCAAGEACRWYALTAPPVGYCIPGCTLFGTECPAFATCDGATTLDAAGAIEDGLACRAIGTTAPGEVCHRSIDCTADHSCARVGTDYVCAPLCDDTHPCVGAGEICRPEGAGASPPSGVCVPG